MISLSRTRRHLQGVTIPPGRYQGVDVSHARGFQSVWKGVELVRCVLDLSELQGAHFEDVTFDQCDIKCVVMAPARFIRCTFRLCDLQNSSFHGSWLTEVTFADCRLQFADFGDAQLQHVTFDHSNLRNAVLTLMTAEDVSYDSSNLWGVRVSLDCHFFRARFDEKWRRRFAGLLAYAWPEGEPGKTDLLRVAANHYGAVERLMKEGADGES